MRNCRRIPRRRGNSAHSCWRRCRATARSSPQRCRGVSTYGTQQIKLPAGHLLLYPGTSLHRVTPVTRGARVASFFWIQSMLREDAQRRLMFDLDVSIRTLTRDVPEHPSLVQLTGVYHNLLRRWAIT